MLGCYKGRGIQNEGEMVLQMAFATEENTRFTEGKKKMLLLHGVDVTFWLS